MRPALVALASETGHPSSSASCPCIGPMSLVSLLAPEGPGTGVRAHGRSTYATWIADRVRGGRRADDRTAGAAGGRRRRQNGRQDNVDKPGYDADMSVFDHIAIGAGIHGTAQEYSIGTRASHGCLRMGPRRQPPLPAGPVGTPVLIAQHGVARVAASVGFPRELSRFETLAMTQAAMKITVAEQDGVTVVAVAGVLDAGGAPVLGDRFDALLAEGVQRFVIDLAALRFMDSSGIAVLVRLFKRVRIGHGDVRLAATQPAVEKILRLVRLDRVFDLHPDVERAVASFSASPAA